MASRPDWDFDITWKPFLLNPQLDASGQDADEYFLTKYGMGPSQVEATRARLKAAGEKVGITFNSRDRISSSYDAHRLVAMAEDKFGAKSETVAALQEALFTAYFTDNRNIGNTGVLVEIAEAVGMDADEVRGVLASEQYEDYITNGIKESRAKRIRGVPHFIIDEKVALSGAQPVAVFDEIFQYIEDELS